MVNKQSINERSNHQEPEADEPCEVPEEPKADADEFKITVKKLDTVVRPRGVLADG